MTNTKQSAELTKQINDIADWLSSCINAQQVAFDEPPDYATEFDMQLDQATQELKRIAALLCAQANDAQDLYFSFEFEVWQGDAMCASTSGPRDTALNEAMRYAEQYRQDGTVRIFEVKRVLIEEIQGMQTGSVE